MDVDVDVDVIVQRLSPLFSSLPLFLIKSIELAKGTHTYIHTYTHTGRHTHTHTYKHTFHSLTLQT
jgi:hypothetical protein